MIDWPEYLIEAIARRKSVLFLGSGISANSCNDAGKHPLTWEAFLRDILAKRSAKLAGQKDVIEQMLKLKDYLTACEIIVETLGDNDFGELAANEFRRPGYKPSDIHEAVYRLDSRLVLTPNIDKIYEQYAMNESRSTVVVKSYYEDDIAKYLRTDDFLIIRVHGYVDDVSKIILGKNNTPTHPITRYIIKLNLWLTFLASDLYKMPQIVIPHSTIIADQPIQPPTKVRHIGV